MSHLWGMLRSHASMRILPFSCDEEFPQFVRRELEILFQAEEFQDIEDGLRRRVRDIVLRLQPAMVALYQQSNMETTGGLGSEQFLGELVDAPASVPAIANQNQPSTPPGTTNEQDAVPLQRLSAHTADMLPEFASSQSQDPNPQSQV